MVSCKDTGGSPGDPQRIQSTMRDTLQEFCVFLQAAMPRIPLGRCMFSRFWTHVLGSGWLHFGFVFRGASNHDV